MTRRFSVFFLSRFGLIFLCIALPFLALIVYQTFSLHQTARDAARANVENLALVLEAKLSSDLEAADRAVAAMAMEIPAEAMRQDMIGHYRAQVSRSLQSRARDIHAVSGLRYFDRRGDLLYTSMEGETRNSIADRLFFRQAQAHPETYPKFSEVIVARSSGRVSMAVYQAVVDQTGAFLGVATGIIDLKAHYRQFQSMQLGKDAAVSMRRLDDGATVVRYPGPLEVDNQPVPHLPIRLAILDNRLSGAMEIISPVDGVLRIYGYRKLGRFPFFVTVGIADSDYLGEWRRQSLIALFAALLFLGLLAAAFVRVAAAEWRRDQAEAARRENAVRLQSMFSAMSEGLLLQDREGRIIAANPAAEAILGHGAGDILGRTCGDLLGQVIGEDGSAIATEQRPAMLALSTGLAQRNQVISITTPGLGMRWICINSVPIFGDHEARPEAVISTFVDITEQRRDAEELARYRRQLEGLVKQRTAELGKAAENTRLFIKQAPLCIAMFDRDMNYLAASDRWVADYGRGESDLIGRNHYDLHPEVSPKWRQIFDQALAGKTFKNNRDLHYRVDGQLRWVRWAALPWTHPSGEIGGIILSAENITEARIAEQALRESEARFRLLASATLEGISLTEQGRIVDCNERLQGMLGYSREELLGKSVGDFIAPEERQQVLLKIQNGSERVSEHRLIRKDGSSFVAEAHGQNLTPEQGSLRITALHDISERMQAEQQLRDARDAAEQANRAKSTFLANMSHEIRTPLHVITGLGHLLRRDLDDPQQQKRLEQLCATSDHLLAIINDVLDLSKIEAERLRLNVRGFRLDAVVDKVLRMVEGKAQEKGLRLRTEVAPALRALCLQGDPLRLAQVLINLCDNAVKFTDQGLLRLEITCPKQDADSVSLAFSVADEGVGMTAAEQQRLFQPFNQGDASSTRERGGTGLGLAISQRLVEMMGGRIGVDSQPGVGSRFSFELTLARAREAEIEAGAEFAQGSLGGRRILLAEDHALSREILQEMLLDIGCEVELAADGAEAVACARARRHDLILMDMQMPKLDGMAATRAIRALPERGDTPIIALTANVFAEDRQRCLDAGMSGHLGKPVTPAALAQTLGRWLSGLSLSGVGCTSESDALKTALAGIDGLDAGPAVQGSPQRLANYCAQLREFLAAQAEDMALLRQHLASGDQDGARVVVHNMAGIAGLIGARNIAALAREITLGFRSGADDACITGLVSACEVELQRLSEAVSALPSREAA